MLRLLTFVSLTARSRECMLAPLSAGDSDVQALQHLSQRTISGHHGSLCSLQQADRALLPFSPVYFRSTTAFAAELKGYWPA